MIYKQQIWEGHTGIFTDTVIKQGTMLFSYAEWVWDEQYGWEVLTTKEVNQLPPEKRFQFLKYAYDIEFDQIIGTFNWDNAIGLSNFMNHSCDPNMVYDMEDNIIARRDILPEEELTIDYGAFIVNVDQDFICSCGSENCRSIIRKDDWKDLVCVYGYGFPRFMHKAISSILAGRTAEPA